jgi:GNAT superfamily N-acetyltransferase
MIREYQPEDEARVLQLLDRSLGGGPAGKRSAEFFRWKHAANPFGASFMILAEADGRIVGLRAFMRWRFVANSREITAVRAVDTATDPDFQGLGIFTRLTLRALEELQTEGVLVFNTPNDKSLPGYLKMGWTPVGKVPVRLRLRRPLRFLRGFRHLREQGEARGAGPPVEAPTASQALRDAEGASFLEVLHGDGSRLATPRTAAYLRWRYGDAPRLDYRAVLEQGRGMAIFRVHPRGRSWEAAVAEVLVQPGDVSAARRLLSRVARAARVDHLTCSFPADWAAGRAAPWAGFVQAPGGPVFVTNPLADGLEPDPRRLESWALSLGDLEVF